MIYYIADMHFGHENVIRFDSRPFADTEQMDEALIQIYYEYPQLVGGFVHMYRALFEEREGEDGIGDD